jgi:AcrR family transcriptional regulator
MTSSISPALRSDARANHIRLLEAATAVFAEQGIDVDVKAVAERAGLAVGTIYRHFPGKDELIAAVMDEATREFAEAIAAGMAEPDPLAALELVLRGGVAVIGRYGEVVSAVLEGRVGDARTAAERAARRAETAAQITTLVRRAVEAGALRTDLPPELMTAVLRAAFVPWVLVELRRSLPAEAIAHGFFEVFLNGARNSNSG